MSRSDRIGRIAVRALMAALVMLATGGLPAALAETPQKDAQTPRASGIEIGEIRVGIAGQSKVGYWLPFSIELRGGAQPVTGHVELILPDGDGVPSRVRTPDDDHGIAIAPGERKTIQAYAKLGQLSSEVTVNFRGTSGVLASRRLRTGAEGPLAGVLPSSATLVVLVSGADPEAKRSQRWLTRGDVARASQFDQLPGDWWGYESVDSLVLTTGSESIAAQLATASPQVAAIDRWVRLGGQLILSVGRNAESLLAAGAPLAALAPGRLDSMVPLRQGTALETYSETLDPIATDAPFDLSVPKLADVRGNVESFAGTGPRDLPLVVRTPHGFGEIVFIAFDLDQSPIVAWKARPALLEKLLRRPRGPAQEDEGSTLGAVTTLGFVDLSGQLRGALDQFSGVGVVPFWLVALLVVIYIACIGPLDYYLVKRVFRRMELTWLTFALTVLLFSGGAVALAYSLKGREVRVNQLDVVDFDVETNLVRGTSWSNVFSPRIETYDLTLKPDGPTESNASDNAASDGADSGVLFSWFGLTGGAFGGMDTSSHGVGGMDTASRSLPLFSVPYDYAAPGNSIRDVPIAVWSSKAFVGRWWRQAPGGIEGKLADEGRLVGTLASQLDLPLTGAVLLYGKWAYVLRELGAGRTLDIETIDPQTADTYLRNVTALGDKQVAPPYDEESFNVPQIVEMMSAHELSGGRRYTGLANQYQRFVEVSGLVRNGRAVLIGRVAKPATKLDRAGGPAAEAETQSWTFYRYVFPVTGAASE